MWGALSVVGHLAIQFLGPFVLALVGRPINQDGFLFVVLASWAWIGVVAFCVRFLVGMKMEKPDGMWSCKNCKYLNQRYAVICEACREPYGKKA